MEISYDQAKRLLKQISDTLPDQLDCDGCYRSIPEFADAEVQGHSLSLDLIDIQTHLQQCPCCAYEYEALCEAIREMERS